MTNKDKKIIEDAERYGIPIFVLKGTDLCSLKALISYREECEAEGCSAAHVIGTEARIREFSDFQKNHKRECKLPD